MQSMQPTYPTICCVDNGCCTTHASGRSSREIRYGQQETAYTSPMTPLSQACAIPSQDRIGYHDWRSPPPLKMPNTCLEAIALHEPRRLDAIIFDADLSLVTSERFEMLFRPTNTEYTCRLSKDYVDRDVVPFDRSTLVKISGTGRALLLPTVEATNLLQGIPIHMQAACRTLGARQQIGVPRTLQLRISLAKCDGPSKIVNFSCCLSHFCLFAWSGTREPVPCARNTRFRKSAEA